MRANIFYSLVVGCASGILCRSLFVFPISLVLTALLIAGVVHFAVAYRNIHASRWSLSILLFVIAFLVGVSRTSEMVDAVRTNALHAYTNTETRVSGIVLDEPDARDRSLLVTVTTNTPAEGKVLVALPPQSDIAYGDVIEVSGVLKLPESFVGDFGREFHYPEYLATRGITHTIRADTLVVTSRGNGNWLIARLYDFKHALSDSASYALPAPAAGLGLGITLGEKRAVGEELSRIFRITGLIHIVVLSGYNISILAEFLMRVLSPWLTLRPRLVLGGAVILLVVLMVGPSASVVRAAIMATLVLLARGTGKTYSVARSLCVAGTLMLLLNPLLLVYDPGFQFSFLATLGLILVAPEMEKWLLWMPTHFQLREFLVGTLSAQIMVLPLLLYTTGLFSTYSVLANILVLPFTPLAMLLTTITAGVGLISSWLSFVVGYPTYLVLSYMLFVAKTIASFPHAGLPVPQFSIWIVVLTYIGMSCGLYYLWRTNRKVSPQKNHLPQAVPVAGDSLPFR